MLTDAVSSVLAGTTRVVAGSDIPETFTGGLSDSEDQYAHEDLDPFLRLDKMLSRLQVWRYNGKSYRRFFRGRRHHLAVPHFPIASHFLFPYMQRIVSLEAAEQVMLTKYMYKVRKRCGCVLGSEEVWICTRYTASVM